MNSKIHSFIFFLRLHKFKIFLFGVFFTILSAAWHVLHDNIMFHTDIARDFYLMQNIVESRKLTLIGPRVGGYNGLYHGPLWTYLNLPAFFLGHGNPVVIGWFWIILFVVALFLIYWVSKKVFGYKTSMLATLIYAFAFADMQRGLFNPNGTLIIYPIFFYFLYRYVCNLDWRNLVLTYFITGILIQFHLGFGLLTLIIVLIISTILAFKTRKFLHLLAFSILILPLSTFITFDIRHNFQQFRKILIILSGQGENNTSYKGLLTLIKIRADELFINLQHLFLDSQLLLPIFIIIVIGVAFYKLQDKQNLYKAYLLFFVLYGAYFCMSIFISSQMPIYYMWALAPIIIIFFAHSILELHNKTTYIFIIAMFIAFVLNTTNKPPADSLIRDISNWRFYQEFVKKAFTEVPDKKIGYFAYSPDLLSYSLRYAAEYTAKQNNISLTKFGKNRYTIVFITPSTDNDNMDWFIKNKLHINKKPWKKVYFYNNAYALIYKLNDKELLKPTESSLDSGLHFR